MPEANTSFVLKSTSPFGDTPVLSGVEASGSLEGTLFELTLRQTYRNAGDSLLEVVYTFPLPHEAVLLGFASELNGQRQTGTIVAKRQAEAQYEKSLAEGDAPVMLEASDGGLHTANIGNLKPGDEIVLEVRYAQLLRFEQGRLRLAIPTTIAPRYGNAGNSGLQPHQVPMTSLTAEYPLSLSVTVVGNWAEGTIECPTHPFTRESVEGSLRLNLNGGVWLDRDVVIVATPLKPLTTVVTAATDAVSTDAPMVVMASFQPPHAAPRQRIALKLLVDCSGSMGGDSIASARVALQGAVNGLTDQDHLSISRFGSTFEHVFGPSALTARAQRQVRPEIARIEADLGGTEMAQALQAVLEIKMPSEDGDGDVLLFTDGEIWDVTPMIESARKSRHRVFVIGVSSSPAEAVLRSLAEATGGACEFATPGEALEAASARMLVRIRQQPWREARIEWRGDAVWQTPLPLSVFGGDTVVAFAGMSEQLMPPSAVLCVKDASGREVEVASGVAEAFSRADTMPRMAAARRLTTADAALAKALAVEYQLMSPHTNCILVHERAEADKATEEARLHQVSSMLAAGWGATAGVMPCAMYEDMATFGGSAGPVSSRIQFSLAADDVEESGSDDASKAALEARLDGMLMSINKRLGAKLAPSLATIAMAVVDHLAHGGQVRGLAAHCQSLELHPEARQALDEVIALGLTDGQALLLLAHWANVRKGGLASSFITTTLQSHVDGLDQASIDGSVAVLERLLGRYENDGWEDARSRRLRQYLEQL